VKVVLITGAAPYLGGPETWKPLRAAAPEIEFVEVDPLIVGGGADMERHVRNAVEAALHDADAVVAHGGAARLALDAVARTRPTLPALLLTPMMVLRTTMPLRIVGAMLEWPFVDQLIIGYARSKLRRLCADRGYVRRQLGFFVRRDLISDELVDEAQRRLRDPRATGAVERTREFMASALAPLDPETDRVVTNRRSVFGGVEYYERKKARQKGGIILPNANGSPMIEDPVAVADILREMLGASSRRV
jgi:hypothetical protein